MESSELRLSILKRPKQNNDDMNTELIEKDDFKTVELLNSYNNNTIILSKDASRTIKKDIQIASNSNSIKIESVQSSNSSDENDIRLNIRPRKSIRQ